MSCPACMPCSSYPAAVRSDFPRDEPPFGCHTLPLFHIISSVSATLWTLVRRQYYHLLYADVACPSPVPAPASHVLM